MIRKFITGLCISFLFLITLSGCATKPLPPKIVIQEKNTYVTIDENLFKSCPKPKKLSFYFKNLNNDSISEKEIADTITKVYLDHIACYKTLLNIKQYNQKMISGMNIKEASNEVK